MEGVTGVLVRDFQQTFPVVRKGTKVDVLEACIKVSQI